MKKTISLVLCALFLSFLFVIPAFASETDGDEDGMMYFFSSAPVLVVDDAGIISANTRTALENELRRIGSVYGLDIVVRTVYTLGYANVADFADDYFDNNGYGQGTDRSGVLFLLSLEERDWYMSTRGYGITVFDDHTIDYVFGKMRSYLSRNDFDSAFLAFSAACEEALAGFVNGNPVVSGVRASGSSFAVRPAGVIFALIVGFLLSLLPMRTLKKQINNISFDNAANNYTRKNSVNLRDSRDIFLYAYTYRVPIPHEQSSGGRGGGGGVHVSSSGASHGGHGGKF